MKSLVLAGLLVYLSYALCACGQKGPLVLPDAPKRKHTIPTLPGNATPKTKEGSPSAAPPAPAESTPATSPPPPASPTAPQPP